MLVTTDSQHDHGGIEKQKAGQSSFSILDSELVFSELNLKTGEYFLDIGCGSGDYAFRAAGLVGDTGFVFALDRWKELIDKLNAKIDLQNIKNMRAIFADIDNVLPITDNNADICLLAMVLHGFDIKNYGEILFSEIYRILKPDGHLAVIEMKKEENSGGHPVHIRLSPDDIEKTVSKYGFKKTCYSDLGCAYLIQFGIDK